MSDDRTFEQRVGAAERFADANPKVANESARHYAKWLAKGMLAAAGVPELLAELDHYRREQGTYGGLMEQVERAQAQRDEARAAARELADALSHYEHIRLPKFDNRLDEYIAYAADALARRPGFLEGS